MPVCYGSAVAAELAPQATDHIKRRNIGFEHQRHRASDVRTDAIWRVRHAAKPSLLLNPTCLPFLTSARRACKTSLPPPAAHPPPRNPWTSRPPSAPPPPQTLAAPHTQQRPGPPPSCPQHTGAQRSSLSSLRRSPHNPRQARHKTPLAVGITQQDRVPGPDRPHSQPVQHRRHL